MTSNSPSQGDVRAAKTFYRQAYQRAKSETLSSYLSGLWHIRHSTMLTTLGSKRESGSCYHAYKAGAYFIPNDDAEQVRIYPKAVVISIDWSPIQPTAVSPTVKFEVDDVEDEWT
ncbi:uncharacterized protein Z518_05573 [Rhinocladiella mackenziei CBS 650.93]|uniref:Uncharacterized protein n=1 Tax=Rhinocladiella mackenziei CBS 650.93 TaxID=1442369 RepID=A0A0D2H2P4_9EURO|nr:uncharacterized protein Z518_05573 [Rhinocladiella mackenziei CBS 650.93]KIX04703.1 hypothetical protein Z518_05573 [Rhinocladiella mackenziei CBS 650.93]